MSKHYFDPVHTPLQTGTHLIEASAGTGKTYAIAMLVLRFVVELGLPIDHILVVTFTKAATQELKERVRDRLATAKKVLAGQDADPDGTISAWLQTLDLPHEQAKQRVALALLDIDQASIETIHGFCQRVLREHALESGQLFDADMLSDLTAIKLACVDDFWRRQIYPRPAWEVAVLTATYKSPEQLLDSVGFIADTVCICPTATSLDAALQQLQNLCAQAKNQLPNLATTVREQFAGQLFKASYTDTFELHYQALQQWLSGDQLAPPEPDTLALLSYAGISDGLNGNKFRANKTQSSAQRKADYLASLSIDTSIFDDLAQAFRQLSVVFRVTLVENLRVTLEERLQKLNAMSFDQLISRLSAALHQDQEGLLKAQLQQRFAAALIDEFQDTDDSQWFIFASLFAVPTHSLYLIGDPKQAIYQFRGADIYSYLQAQKQAEHHFTLGKNWRSHPQLVSAVNTLFAREHAFLLEDLQFYPLEAAKTADNGELVQQSHTPAPMQLWQLPESDSKSGYWTAGKAAEQICLAVADEIVVLLSQDARLQPQNQPLRAQDIAILVRTNAQARQYQTALRRLGVPAVLNNTESVFATPEALHLFTLLQAIAQAADLGLLKQALALPWFGFDGPSLYQLNNNEAALDVWLARFADYHLTWQKNGLMAMMQRVWAEENIQPTLAQQVLAERQLTNLHQLVELVQLAAIDGHLGIHKTLAWLHTAIHQASPAEDQQLRLESDDDAVKIVTLHRSKGLEYAVVFCPTLWQRSERLRNEQEMLKCHVDGRLIVDLGSPQFEQHRALALNEELAEDLRIAYVAVTRAKYCCYVAWADVRSENHANNSALAWLLDFADADFNAQQLRLQTLASQQPSAFAYRLLNLENDQHPILAQQQIAAAHLQSRPRQRSLYTSWQMSSYTALSALSLRDTPELPNDKAREQTVASAPTNADELPKGAGTGNVVHELLENNSFAELALGKDISAQRDQACQRYGLKLPQPILIDTLLQHAIATPLSADDPQFCLQHLPDQHCLKEMPFYLAMRAIDAKHINALLQDSPSYQALDSKSLSGYLTGFIDLICAYQGRYYVMDYKTNSLPDYQPDTLTHAMREHNYGLQYWLYTVVLHVYLQQRLPDYDYDTHVGGVRYLFVRGMQPNTPMSGVYQDRPKAETVAALARLLCNA